MIQIRFDISSKDSKTARKIQFCDKNEKNLDILYGIAKESAGRKKSGFEQLMMICCFHVVEGMRKNAVAGIIEDRILTELSEHQEIIEILRDVKKISIEVTMNNIPKRVLSFSSKGRDYRPIPAESRVLR